jgi:hypothetical protein
LGSARSRPAPLPGPASVDETTQTHFVTDESPTNRISWDADEPTLRRLGPDELEELNPADELGLDRPIFTGACEAPVLPPGSPPPPTGPDTREDIDLALVAATAVPESPPAPLDDMPRREPPVAAESVHEVVFEVGPDDEPTPAGSSPLPEALAAPARRVAARRFSSAPYPPVRLALAPRRSPLWVIIPVAAMIGAGGVMAILVAVDPLASTPSSPAPAAAVRPPEVHRSRPAPQPRVDQLLSRARASLDRADHAAALADYERLARDPRCSEPRLKAEIALGLSEVALQLSDRGSALRHARAALGAAEASPSLELRARARRQLERCAR